MSTVNLGGTLVSVTCLLLVRVATGLQCLYCAESIQPTECDTVATCGSHEVCFVDTYVSGTGRIRYKMGCRDRNQCATQPKSGKRMEYSARRSRETQIKAVNESSKNVFSDLMRRSEDMLVCSECCATTSCNAAGCGSQGYPSKRGPVCFNCQYHTTIGDCDKITLCGRDETCKLVKTNEPVMHNTRYQTGCENEVRCNEALEKLRQTSAVLIGKRSRREIFYNQSSCIMKCCKSDLCNSNCYSTSEPLFQSSSMAPSTSVLSLSVASNLSTMTPTAFCLSNPCQRGTCSEYHNTYKCTCLLGFWGRNCEFGSSVLTAVPSQHASTTFIQPVSSMHTVAPTHHPSTISYATAYDCDDILQSGIGTSDGVYSVTLWRSHRTIQVYCDQTTAGGGWTVFQKRLDGTVEFNRNYANYTNGFGLLTGEFWLGLEHIHEMTIRRLMELRIDLTAANGSRGYEVFRNFNISEGPGYVLHNVHGTGTIGDPFTGFSAHTGHAFSTFDHDNDSAPTRNCANDFHGGWWFHNCHGSYLNGLYITPGTENIYSMSYPSFTGGFYYSLKASTMMFRNQN